jgi:hypothetical protein
MKLKLKGVVGVALTLVLMASLMVGLASVPASGATTSNLKFSVLDLPKVEEWTNEATFADAEGDFWATPDADCGPMAMDPEGDVLFAAAHDDGQTFFEVLKSGDGGYGWTVTGYYDAATAVPIVDIVTSPEYGDDTTVCVANEDYVYISDDGGKNFVELDDPWAGDITDLDVAISDDGDLVLMVGTDAGEIWVKKGLLGWQDQLLQNDLPATDAVLASNFLPTFAADGDIGICAIVTDSGAPSTIMTFTFNDINDGEGWGTSGIANAPFTNADGDPFESEWARTAFPDDFDAFGVGSNICFAGVVEWGDLGATGLGSLSGSDAYKVICKEAGTSTAVDLDVRGVITTLLPTATPVTSIEVCGEAEEATILVGTDCLDVTDTPECFLTYHSEDSGDSWQFSFKQPTGGDEQITDVTYTNARTQVLMAPDFCGGSTAYAVTKDWGGPIGTSAFQRTTDGAASWNQISLIDDFWTDDDYWACGYGFNAAGYLANDRLRMITTHNEGEPPILSTYGALYERMGTTHWERVLSYATVGVSDSLCQISDAADGSATFIVDIPNNCMWRTTDDGATFPKKINTKDGLQWVTAVSATTLYTAHDASAANNSGIWWTTKSGTGWSKPDDSEIPNSAVVPSVSVMGDIVICSTYDGEAFISSDGGENVEKVGKNTPGVAGPPTIVTADLGFAANGMLYAVTMMVPDHGIWRTSVDLDDPGDCSWKRIDDNQDSTGTPVEYDESTVSVASPAITLPPSGILYVADCDGASADTGGLWRSTNPTADEDSVYPPYFERETKGLDTGDSIGLRTLDLAPPNLTPTIFFQNANPDDYWEQIVYFTDTLNIGVSLASPAADETGVGLLPEGYVYPEVGLFWADMAGALSYQYQVALDPDFKTVVAEGFTTSLASPPMDLHPNSSYYWRVRVADEGTLIGAPLISPWSQVYKFKTAIGASMARPDLQAPWPGEPDVPLSPTFEWSGIEWAEVYEFELSVDPSTTAGGYFTEPLVALVSADALVSTAWKCDITLDYNIRYYWHVKAIGVDTDTPWSDVGTFTTMSQPPATPTAEPPITIPPTQQITPAWIWAVVIIGAILVIAVIVLIVTTRRVP